MPSKQYWLNQRCVYCLKEFASRDLTDEHIIPKSIHGAYVIKDGACKPCAQLSNEAYENEALALELLIPRRLLGLKGRNRGRKAGPPKLLPRVAPFMGGAAKGNDFSILLEPEDYPPFFSLPVFQPAGRLVDIDRGSTLELARIMLFSIGPNPKAPLAAETYTLSKNGPLATTIAKIAYCYAVAEKGFDAFDGDDIRDLLAGLRDDVYNFVGNPNEIERLATNYLHGLYFRERGEWLTVLVHLFASCHGNEGLAVPYEVVVGRLKRMPLRPATPNIPIE